MNQSITEIFKPVSVRGRVAFAIACLESVLLQLEPNPESWLPLLNHLWSFTSTDDLEYWFEKTVECLPECLEEYFTEGEPFEILSHDECVVLRQLYTTCHPIIHELIGSICDIGTVQLYGGLGDCAPESLRETQRLVNMLSDAKLNIAPTNPFLSYKFSEEHGWGMSFDARSHRVIRLHPSQT